MATDLNTVKMASTTRDGYHHGNLRAALLAAAEEVLSERGVAGFSLRETARRAGVSPGAPTHHFGDSAGLLTAVAASGFTRLEAALRAARGDTQAAHLVALGGAYLRFAQASPAVFGIMWSRELLIADNAAYVSAGEAAYLVLERAVVGSDPDGPRPDPAVIAAWSLIHGLTELSLQGAFAGVAESAISAALARLGDFAQDGPAPCADAQTR